MEAQDLPTITSFTNMSALIAWPFIADILGRIPVIPGPPPPPPPPVISAPLIPLYLAVKVSL